MSKQLAALALILLATACSNQGSQPAGSGPSPVPPVTATPPNGPFTFTGVVFESVAGGRQPVAGVNFDRFVLGANNSTTFHGSSTTDAQGRFTVPNLEPDTQLAARVYSFRSDPAGRVWYQPCAAPARMTSNATVEIELVRNWNVPRTHRTSPRLSGRLFNGQLPDGSLYPADGRIASYRPGACRTRGAPELALALTGADGGYELCRLPRGTGCLTITPASGYWDYDTAIVELEIEGDSVFDLDLDRAVRW